MLGIMMMRAADAGIFEKTKPWLQKMQCFPSDVDELHLIAARLDRSRLLGLGYVGATRPLTR